jgi:RNA polymerase sigma-70 factor (ECF subfamily)
MAALQDSMKLVAATAGAATRSPGASPPHHPSAQENPLPAPKPQPSDESERQLIERACAGDKDAFCELIHPYERVVYLSAFSILKNEADAEDVAQEAIVKALQHLKSFRREAKFSTWLVQIAINESRMRLRKDRPGMKESLDEGRQTEEGDYLPKDYADWREIPSEALERKQLRDVLEKAIMNLAPIYREVFILRDVQDVSIAETAKALGITEATVKTRLLRARFQMRDAIAPGIDGAWSLGDGSWKKVRPW